MAKFIATIDGRDVLPATSGAGYSSPLGMSIAAKHKVNKLKGSKTPPNTRAVVKTAKPKPKPKPKPVPKATSSRPAAITTPSAAVPKPVATATTAAASGGGMSLGMIAVVAGGLFLVVVLLGRRKR